MAEVKECKNCKKVNQYLSLDRIITNATSV